MAAQNVGLELPSRPLLIVNTGAHFGNGVPFHPLITGHRVSKAVRLPRLIARLPARKPRPSLVQFAASFEESHTVIGRSHRVRLLIRI